MLTYFLLFTLVLRVHGQSITLTSSELNIKMPGSYDVTCKLTDSKTSTMTNVSNNVGWFYGNTSVSATSSNRVFQEKSEFSSRLHFVNVRYIDEGTYYCRFSFANVSDENNFTLTVPSGPTIQSIYPISSDGNLSVTWNPHTNALGLVHRVSAYTKTEVARLIVGDTTGIKEPIRTILHLKHFGEINITVSPCINNTCSEKYTSKRNIITSPPDIGALDVSLKYQAGNKTCLLTWNPTISSNSTNFTEYEIEINSTVARFSPRMNDTIIRRDKKVLHGVKQYEFNTIPNQKYLVHLRAEGSSKVEKIILPRGDCISDTTAPTFVPAPMISITMNYDVTKNVNLTIPEEKNGPISCLIVIVTPGKTSIVPSPFEQKHFPTNHNVDNKNDYIALALDVSKNPSKEFRFALGDGSHSVCNNSRINDGNATWEGHNKKISRNSWYSLYVVAVTGNNLYKASNVTTFQHTLNLQSNSWIIQACIAASVACLFIVAIIVYRCRKRKKSSGPSDYLTQSEGYSTFSTLPRTLPRGGKIAERQYKVDVEKRQNSVSCAVSSYARKQNPLSPIQKQAKVKKQIINASDKPRSKSVVAIIENDTENDHPDDKSDGSAYESIRKYVERSKSVDAGILVSPETTKFKKIDAMPEEDSLGVDNNGYLTPILIQKLSEDAGNTTKQDDTIEKQYENIAPGIPDVGYASITPENGIPEVSVKDYENISNDLTVPIKPAYVNMPDNSSKVRDVTYEDLRKGAADNSFGKN